MSWSNVLLILKREIRDQLRDRRTLFMIFVLPVLLYPFMGMSFLQLTQFIRESPTRVLVFGRDELPEDPALLEEGRFAARWFEESQIEDAARRDREAADKARLLELDFAQTAENAVESEAGVFDRSQRALQEGEYQAVVHFPPGMGARLEELRRQLASGEQAGTLEVPTPQVYHNTAKKKSQITYGRVTGVLRRWREAIADEHLEAAGVSPEVAQPFALADRDVAHARTKHAAMWSMVFPFLLLIWSLTGAFYPAIDLCAGEKERGTLETLLCSPAQRGEIVWGKLLTVMLFSVGTVVLNLAAVGFTGWFLITRLKDGLANAPELGPPPPLAFLWLFLAVIPVSALFSALCLALAALARSNKEGQYYLMPLFLVTLPLVLLPMSPGFELTLGNSMIPVTGVVLLLRSAIEGDYFEALRYLAPVVGVTAVCCLLAVRWAVDQFNRESVLFRESERFELGLWLKSLVRDRRQTPTVAAAMLCGALILLMKFFLGFSLGGVDPIPQTAIVQLAAIAAPAVILALLLTRNPRKTLLLARPRWSAVPAALLLAVAFHPVANFLGEVIQRVYPVSDELARAMEQFVGSMPGFWTQLAIIALLPAVCEELAFRGFILSGFRHMGHKRLAILFSSVLFGLTHSIFQQQILTCLVGVVIGYIAVQSGSLLVAGVFHFAHNALVVLLLQMSETGALARFSWLRVLYVEGPEGVTVRWQFIALGAVASGLLLLWFRRLPYQKSEEETLQEALESQPAGQVAAG